MINLTFISTLAYNYFFPGKIRQAGGNTRPYILARKFAQMPGYSVNCVVGNFGQPGIMEKEGVRLIRAPIDKPRGFFKVFSLLRSIKSDIYLDFCASPRLFLLHFLKKPTRSSYIFFTGHDNDVTRRYRDVENSLYYRAYIFGLKRADAIICQVPEHVALLKKNYNLSSKLVLSPYFDISPRTGRGKKEINLWVGRAAVYKNPEMFVALAEKFPQEKFVMICNESRYDNGFMAAIYKRLTKLKNLHFLDYVSYPDMQKYFESAKLLINTSDSEGFPNTFIEAAMTYTPVLSLNVDPNEMFSRFQCGICCNGDTAQFFATFQSITCDAQKLNDYGKNAFLYAEKNHQLSSAVEKIDGIIREVLKNKRETVP